MTDMAPSPPHPDDERLSAALDGHDPDGVVAGHLAGCAPCRRRSDALAAVQALVATPAPALPPAVVDGLVERAVAVAPIVPRQHQDRQHRERRQRVRWRTPPVWLGAVAAALFAVAGIVSVSRAISSNPSSASKVAVGASRSAQDSAADSAATGSGVLLAGDLGAVDDGDALVAALGSARAAAGQASAATAGGAEASGATGDATAEAPKSMAPAAPAPAAPAPAAVCGDEARAVVGSAAGLTSALTLRYAGSDAEVFVFTTAGDPGRRAVVLGRAGCGLLADRRF
jgi:predicted anti-sigma-YlaC factor YlaD